MTLTKTFQRALRQRAASPAAEQATAARLWVLETPPLISRGERIGLINRGRRLSDQDYWTDDRRLLDKLAAQASPAVRVAQLVALDAVRTDLLDAVGQTVHPTTASLGLRERT